VRCDIFTTLISEWRSLRLSTGLAGLIGNGVKNGGRGQAVTNVRVISRPMQQGSSGVLYAVPGEK
jgi:hypothetical protein